MGHYSDAYDYDREYKNKKTSVIDYMADQEDKDISRLAECFKTQEEKDIDKFVKFAETIKKKDMGFLQEIQELAANHKSPKLEDVKFRIKKHASNGEKEMTLDSDFYDKYVMNWLEAQGFKVEETFDQRDGNFIRIKW